jgi:hypothetical protein
MTSSALDYRSTAQDTPDVRHQDALPAPLGLLRRLSKHPKVMHYHRLIVTVLAVNAALVVVVARAGWFASDAAALAVTSWAVLANFALAVLIRQQYVVNLLFWLATRAPTSWPLRLRWTLGKVYHFGGLHVGAAVAGTSWFVVHVGWLTRGLVTGGSTASPLTAAATYTILVLLLLIVATALPKQRARRHDRFEFVHRFGGWSVLALFWVQTLSAAHDRQQSADWPDLFAAAASQSAILAVMTLSVALPWLRLRRVPIETVSPSSHVALARFDHGVTPFAGSSTAISRHPLKDWHAFANAPQPGRSGFRLAISRAGDWTGSFVDDLPDRVWVKGIPTAGVANIEVLFTRVVYVATGSGVGPCLPHLLAGKVPSHLVWATRSPRETYGDALVDEILAVQPDAVIWDTTRDGKPDMVRLAYRAYVQTGAEAVICISNKKLTWDVVYGLEQRGIPAYGAIWDS